MTDQTTTSSQRLESLITSSAQVLRDHGHNVLLEALFDRLAETLQVEMYANFLLDDSGLRLQLVASKGLSPGGLATVETLDLGVAVCGTVAQVGERMVVSGVQERTDDVTSFIRSEGITAYACCPLKVKGRVVGTLSLGTRERSAFDESILGVMDRICGEYEAALEQMEVEKQLSRQGRLLEMAHDAIITWELDGRITYWGQGAESLYGYRSDEAVGRTVHELLATSVEGGIESLRATLVAQGEWQGDLYHQTADGQEVIVAGRLVLTSEGARQVVLEINRDITDLKRTERELMRAHDVKDEFLGILAHEIRSPLTTVVGLAREVERKLQTEGEPPLAEAAELSANAQRMANLLQELFQLARLEAEPLELEPVKLDRQLQRWLEERRARMPHRQLMLDLRRDIPIASGSPVLLEQVLDNLLQNADKYSPRHQPIEVGIYPSNHHVTVEVRDRGPGLTAGEIDQVFKRFFRGRRIDDSVPGQGLGLAICRRLIELQNGEIWARTREGGGSIFGFNLPLLE